LKVIVLSLASVSISQDNVTFLFYFLTDILNRNKTNVKNKINLKKIHWIYFGLMFPWNHKFIEFHDISRPA